MKRRNRDSGDVGVRWDVETRCYSLLDLGMTSALLVLVMNAAQVTSWKAVCHCLPARDVLCILHPEDQLSKF
jgi:hypothetical protein